MLQANVEFILQSSPKGKTMEWTQVKAFADNKVNVTEVTISVFQSMKNIKTNEENAGLWHFLLST